MLTRLLQVAGISLILTATVGAAPAGRPPAEVVCLGPVELTLPPTWFPGRDPRDQEVDDIYLVSPFLADDAEIQIIGTLRAEAGTLDALVAHIEGAYVQSPELAEKVTKRRRFRIAGSGIEVEETQSKASRDRSFVTWYAVVGSTGVVLAGRTPTKSYERYLPILRAVLSTLAPHSANKCRTPLVLMQIPAGARASQDWRSEAVYLHPRALDEKLDFDVELRKHEGCTAVVRPVFEPKLSSAKRLELDATCAGGHKLHHVIENIP